MTSLSITISEERWLQLEEKAEHFGVTPEDLVRLSIEEMLTRPEETFQRAMDYVLAKNDELYRRLAAA